MSTARRLLAPAFLARQPLSRGSEFAAEDLLRVTAQTPDTRSIQGKKA